MAKNIITCNKCGKSVDLDFYEYNREIVQQMREKSLCFDCAFWSNVISHPSPDNHIISGKLYSIKLLPGYLKKYQRRKNGVRFLQNLETGEIWGSLEYTMIGVVPETFKQLLPDEFKFISRSTYEKIHEFGGSQCFRKGCYDRYHCFWYNKDIAEPNGPWNIIPDNYIIGKEMCESFIDKNKMYDDL